MDSKNDAYATGREDDKNLYISDDRDDKLGGWSQDVAPVAVFESEEQVPEAGKKTRRHLKARHVQLMAISGNIGTGLFVSNADF